jgi:hypothetical protein
VGTQRGSISRQASWLRLGFSTPNLGQGLQQCFVGDRFFGWMHQARCLVLRRSRPLRQTKGPVRPTVAVHRIRSRASYLNEDLTHSAPPLKISAHRQSNQ